MGGVCSLNWEDEEDMLLVGKLEGKRPLRIPRCRCVDNIMMDLVEIGRGGVDWTGLI
jgi:hypothetical protein